MYPLSKTVFVFSIVVALAMLLGGQGSSPVTTMPTSTQTIIQPSGTYFAPNRVSVNGVLAIPISDTAPTGGCAPGSIRLQSFNTQPFQVLWRCGKNQMWIKEQTGVTMMTGPGTIATCVPGNPIVCQSNLDGSSVLYRSTPPPGPGPCAFQGSGVVAVDASNYLYLCSVPDANGNSVWLQSAAPMTATWTPTN